MARFYNILGATSVTVELVAPNSSVNIKSVLITNVHSSADATVTLFIQNNPISGGSKTYNLIHTIAVPAHSSLLLDESSMFRFALQYGLYITVGSSDTVDVLIN